MGLTALAVIVAGFAPTYYLGFWFDAPPLKPIVHIHAAAFTAWLVLLPSQILLIRLGRFQWHRAMGKVAVGLVVVMVITGYMVIFGKPRPTAAARAFIFTPMQSLLLFPLFVAAAIHFRRDPATHKRLMLLATIAIATAGISRLMVMLGLDATHYHAYAATYAVLLLPLIIFDLARLGTLHRATAWGSLLLLLRHALHQVIANTDQWQRIAAWLTPPV
jgi:cation transport ATPase